VNILNSDPISQKTGNDNSIPTAPASAPKEAGRAAGDSYLQMAQKMESVGTLAGGIAHDFNNLLTAIISYSDMLLAKMDSDNPMRKEIGEIRGAGERAAHLARQLLAFSRRRVRDSQILNINQVLSDLTPLMRGLVREKIELIPCLQPNLGLVMADPGQIEQVIINIVINARDAMPNGGKLVLLTADVHMDPAEDIRRPEMAAGNYVLFALSDTGPGIGADVLPHIFEPFFTTKERGVGSGLGLSTAHEIIKQSGGHIYAFSEPGSGTTFEIYLPLADRH
jgi:signal transduction histidine kinase